MTLWFEYNFLNETKEKQEEKKGEDEYCQQDLFDACVDVEEVNYYD